MPYHIIKTMYELSVLLILIIPITLLLFKKANNLLSGGEKKKLEYKKLLEDLGCDPGMSKVEWR